MNTIDDSANVEVGKDTIGQPLFGSSVVQEYKMVMK